MENNHRQRSRCPRKIGWAGSLSVVLIFRGATGHAQQVTDEPPLQGGGARLARPAGQVGHSTPTPPPQSWTERERYLLEKIEQLERRVVELESRVAASSSSKLAQPSPRPQGPSQQFAVAISPGRAKSEDRKVPEFLHQTTFNLTLDSYYGYNFNRPIGRINLLRAYDVLSNSFSLNQAAVVIEHLPNPGEGRRLGTRLDLQYARATETLQGNAANEPRPQVYRPIFQAFGTYVAPIGSGLTIDFGKWASALGIEINYTKDQLNYSRSYLYNFLPFYHFGIRASYKVSNKLTAMYWLVNGINQSEDLNGSKSHAVILNFKPMANLSWNLNYYTGVEGRATSPLLNPGLPALPTQPGLSTALVRPEPSGRLHILDTYITWNTTPKLLLAGEADYVVNRMQSFSVPSHISSEAGYARYQFTQKFDLAGRAEYLSDRGGLFSGVTQALKETTLTADYRLAEGFLVRGEWRRDFSNLPFFLTHTPGLLKREQNTATLGLIWWMGGKKGAW